MFVVASVTLRLVRIWVLFSVEKWLCMALASRVLDGVSLVVFAQMRHEDASLGDRRHLVGTRSTFEP